MNKNIVIGVLSIIILIMGGTLFYLNNNKNHIENAPKSTTTAADSKKDSSQNSFDSNVQPNEEINSSNKINSNYINAVYWGENGSNGIILFSDGKCVDFHVNSEYNLGTYTIENGKLVLTLQVYDEMQVHTYNITNDYQVIISESGYTLKRLN